MTRLPAILGLAIALGSATLGASVLVSAAPAAPSGAIDVVDTASPPLAPSLERPARAVATPPVNGALPDGIRLRVPRLGIDLPLRPGDLARDIDAQATPSGAAFLLPGSAVPGMVGNAYVYAHARAGLFLALWNARLGDTVQVVEPSGAVLSYVVREIHPRVDPGDLRYVAPSTDERITLQTSTGPWALNPRFLVVAVRWPATP